jgi:PKD repeat protein
MNFRKNMSAIRVAATALAAATLWASAEPSWGQAAWWNQKWPYRRAVTVPAPAKATRLGGDEIAAMNMPTAGLPAADGGDIRVATMAGTEVPCRVLMVGPGDEVKLAFAIRGVGNTFHVYFGNPAPPPAKEQLEIKRGVLQETWLYEGGGIKTLKEVEAVIDKAKKILGRDFRPNVFVGHNPFGPENTLATRFTAYLDCPTAGKYEFASSSQDASFLLIDDKEVVDNGGHHAPQNDIRMKGSTDLKAGLHKLTFYHVNTKDDPVAVAAWQAPGDTKIWPISEKSFPPVYKCEVGPIEQYGRGIAVDFIPTYGGETFLRETYYQRWAFEALKGPTIGKPEMQWDFGDGQKSTAAKVDHVYLMPGPYTVTLTAKTYRGEMTVKNRIFVSRPWDQVATNRLDDQAVQAKIVQDYDFAALSPEANAHAILMLDKVGASAAPAVRKAGQALLARPEAPGEVVSLVLPLFADAMPPKDRVAAYLTAEKMTKSVATRAEMAELAGRNMLRNLDDPDEAMKTFERIVRQYGPATNCSAIRAAKIGIGDVWRFRGKLEEARTAYTTAGYGINVNMARLEITKGDYARHVEDYLRKNEFTDAEDFVEQWAGDLPGDKLEGYWSLLVTQLCLRKKEYDAAVREVNVLVKVNPTSNYAAQLLLLSSEAYKKLGKDDQAKAALEKIVKNYPESPLAAEAAKALK